VPAEVGGTAHRSSRNDDDGTTPKGREADKKGGMRNKNLLSNLQTERRKRERGLSLANTLRVECEGQKNTEEEATRKNYRFLIKIHPGKAEEKPGKQQETKREREPENKKEPGKDKQESMRKHEIASLRKKRKNRKNPQARKQRGEPILI